jgi:biotin carboxylase
MAARVLLLIPTNSYKAEDFLDAAARLGVQVVVGSDRRQALEKLSGGTTLTVDFTRPEAGVRRIVEQHARTPFAAVVGVDDETTLLAAEAARALGLPHNPPQAVIAARSKLETRRRLQSAALAVPWFFVARLDRPAGEAAARARYPCVLKPLGLSASRGVLRVDDEAGFEEAFFRIAAILAGGDVRRKGVDTERLLVEEYLPGGEVALEGLLQEGRLQLLALFDKPDPMEGPTFEETIYVTPSRLPPATREAAEREVAAGCAALGLRSGPVHAELRVRDGKVWLLEVAPRTIGGLCSRVLRFGAGTSLEEIVLYHALGDDGGFKARESRAAGVMMIPVPRAGRLRAIHGLEAARSGEGIEEVTMTVHRGSQLVPLPEGDRYVGFIFARGESPAGVERSLREAHGRLRLEID